MRILVLGAAGRTGREVVRQALTRGYTVTAFVRETGELKSGSHLKVVVGDAEDAAAVKEAFRGCDAVVSVLGHTSFKESYAQTRATKALLEIMPVQSRFISLTGYAVEDDRDPKTPLSGRLVNWFIKRIPGARFDDGDRHAALLRKSSVQWTLIRATRLNMSKGTGHYELGYFSLGARIAISRADVATAMLDCLSSNQWAKQAPMIRPR